jgi:ECF sigma factor
VDDRDDVESPLEVDAALVVALRRSGFAGPRYQLFENNLERQGRRILDSWMRAGLIFRRCRDKGAPLATRPRDFTRDDRATLASDTLLRALPDFRARALVGGGWRPELGASLITYFVNSLPLHFANPYRAWCRKAREEEQLDQVVHDDRLTPHVFGVEDPEELYVTRDSAVRSLRGLDRRTAEVVALSADGYTQAEVGLLLGISRKAVERIIGRHHQRLSEGEEPGE